MKQTGGYLGLRYALEGSVQPTDGRVRVNAQLIDAKSGAHLWAETFDHDRPLSCKSCASGLFGSAASARASFAGRARRPPPGPNCSRH